MNVNLKNALEDIGTCQKMFIHNGVPMDKAAVKAVLNYGISKGYETTNDLSDAEIDLIIKYECDDSLLRLTVEAKEKLGFIKGNDFVRGFPSSGSPSKEWGAVVLDFLTELGLYHQS